MIEDCVTQESEALDGLRRLAHDIDNILATIRTNAAYVKSKGGCSAQQCEALDEIEEAVFRGGELTQQLRCLFRRGDSET